MWAFMQNRAPSGWMKMPVRKVSARHVALRLYRILGGKRIPPGPAIADTVGTTLKSSQSRAEKPRASRWQYHFSNAGASILSSLHHGRNAAPACQRDE